MSLEFNIKNLLHIGDLFTAYRGKNVIFMWVLMLAKAHMKFKFLHLNLLVILMQ